ncbi:hypothetical protein OAS18_07310, partial [Nitrospinaceae bacterium]|nr:hypothetical protein [Nitrospinaceae bacterium]
MQTDTKDPSPLFNYMNGSLPPLKWLTLMLLAASTAVIVFLGVGEGSSLFYAFAYGKSHAGEFLVDPILSEFIPKKIPFIFKIVSGIYEIPFYHLLFGVLFKGLALVAYFFLAWRITRSSFASMIAVLMIFGLLKFEIGAETIINLKLPFIPDSMEFRSSAFLSFRQASAPLIIVGTIFFLSRKFVFSSIFLALSVYCHPHNGMIFFVALNITFLFCILFWRDRLAALISWVKFILPYLVIISPYLLNALSTFRNVEPIPFLQFWELTIKNEASDASTLFTLNNTHPPYLLSFYLTLAALFIHFLFKSNIPKIKLNIKNLIRDDRDMLLPIMLAPWALIGFGCLWELGMMNYLPDFLNDIIATLHIRRASMVSIILYMPIFAMLLSRIIFVLSEKLGLEMFGEFFLINLRTCLGKINLKSIDHIFSVGLSLGLLLFVILIKNQNIETFKEYWVFDPIGYEHALRNNPNIYEKGSLEIPASSLIEVCNWIKNNTPVNAAFFNPSYMIPFRSCSKRQGFIEEKLDGNFAIADRRYAKIYYERFEDIHRGLSYLDFPEKYTDLSEAFFPTIKKRYLSLDADY